MLMVCTLPKKTCTCSRCAELRKVEDAGCIVCSVLPCAHMREIEVISQFGVGWNLNEKESIAYFARHYFDPTF
jgi:hypothetical protein